MIRPVESSVLLAMALCVFSRTSLSARGTSRPPQNQNELATPSSQAGPVIGTTAGTVKGTISGTVTDAKGVPVSGAVVTLGSRDAGEVRSVVANENGFFEISDVPPGRPYQVGVRAEAFSEWDSPVFTLDPGQSKILDAIKLRIAEVTTTLTVTPQSSEEIATEQVKAEEKQRGFGIIPNFYAVYAPNPAPLSATLKFRLSLRAARDPVTIGGVAILAGIGQATNHPDFRQGAAGYGERLALNYGNSFSDLLLEGAILPSLLHQDPRYFYKGTGTVKARFAHVIGSIFITKADDGSLQPNYSCIGGDLASAALQNLYSPRVNRGAGLVLQGFATTIAVHLAIRTLDEFVFRPTKGSLAN